MGRVLRDTWQTMWNNMKKRVSVFFFTRLYHLLLCQEDVTTFFSHQFQGTKSVNIVANVFWEKMRIGTSQIIWKHIIPLLLIQPVIFVIRITWQKRNCTATKIIIAKKIYRQSIINCNKKQTNEFLMIIYHYVCENIHLLSSIIIFIFLDSFRWGSEISEGYWEFTEQNSGKSISDTLLVFLKPI